MEWLTCIRKTIDIIEDSLTEKISVGDIAKRVFISEFMLQRGFSVMTGYSIGEYIRCRRLYLAAVDIQRSDEKIIDIAIKYAYETPESFTKAFTRFHGATPMQVRAGARINIFLPLKINVSIIGGDKMNVKITSIPSFEVIGFAKEFLCENSFDTIPMFWDEIFPKYSHLYLGAAPQNELEEAFIANSIGEYGICIDNIGVEGKLCYMIAGKYAGGNVPEGMSLYSIKGGEWAIFDCVGPMPNAIQNTTTRIYNEWLPLNPDYEICGDAMIEWYDPNCDDTSAPDYHSAVWVPIKRK